MEKLLKVIAISTIIVMLYAMFTSCNRYVSVDDAANGKARCGQWLK